MSIEVLRRTRSNVSLENRRTPTTEIRFVYCLKTTTFILSDFMLLQETTLFHNSKGSGLRQMLAISIGKFFGNFVYENKEEK